MRNNNVAHQRSSIQMERRMAEQKQKRKWKSLPSKELFHIISVLVLGSDVKFKVYINDSD